MILLVGIIASIAKPMYYTSVREMFVSDNLICGCGIVQTNQTETAIHLQLAAKMVVSHWY